MYGPGPKFENGMLEIPLLESVTMLAECADLVLLNGKIISMDRRDRIFEAVAVRHGRIIAVTSNKQVVRLIGKNTRVLDLGGKAVTPGLIDTHSHLALAGVNKTSTMDFMDPPTGSVQEIVDRVKERVSKSCLGDWVIGRNWDETLLKERRYISKWDLDPVSQHNPVVLFHVSGHALVANTLTLRLAGVDAATADPEGSILKDGNGEPTGVLKDSALGYVLERIPPWTVQQLDEGIKKIQEEWIREGITANKDPGLMSDCAPMLQAYRNLHAKKQLKIRSCLLWKAFKPDDVVRASSEVSAKGDEMLKVVGVKTFVDGSLRIRTAWMHDEYNIGYDQVDVGNKGQAVIDLGTLEKLVLEAHRRGLQACIHAVGDRAIDATLDVLENVVKKSPRRDHRHSIIHFTIPRRKALRRVKALGAVVETQSSFLYFIGDILAGNLGPKRSKKVMPLRSCVRMGITVGNSADCDFYPLPPRFGLYAACTRRPAVEAYGREPLGTTECLTVREALRTYTSWAARCLFWEDKIGSIEPGKYGDFAVWSEDPYSVPKERLKDLKVEMTIIGGDIVYAA